jgi:saccharopine dehydrogenase-like NADP-dependent oxidoreductase
MHVVMVLGGYGFFGQRICASLARNPDIHLLVAGRDSRRAEQFAKTVGLGVDQAVTLDAASPQFPARLQELSVQTLIHTAGPFQQQSYTVARAAIDAGSNYIDLADGRLFVAGIGVLDTAAKERNVSVISGASSVPAPSSAVVDRYAAEFQRLDSIQLGIASGARSPGLATVRGIFGYCGKPFARWSQGQWVDAYGWLNLTRHRFPLPVGSRWLGSCDIPDLALFPARYPSVQTVSFQAGFASDTGHLLLWALAGLVKAGVLHSLSPFALSLNRISRRIERWVSDKGAMFVQLDGTGLDGKPLTKLWNLLALQNHGPHIPCGAAIALTRKLVRGELLPKGAMPCLGLLSIEEYLAPLRDLDIHEIPP